MDDQPMTPAPPMAPHRVAATRPKHRGVLNARRVRFTAFVVISLGLFTVAFMGILAVWDFTTRDTAWRALATLGIVAITMIIFTIINEIFGASASE